MDSTESEELILKKRGYKLVTKIGEGAYANVFIALFQATQESIPCKLACKVINTKQCTKKFAIKFLPRELDILIKLNHPHIIHTHSIFQRKYKYYIFMRYAEKGDLLDYVLKNGPIVEPQARFWVKQMAQAIDYLHSLFIAHRDLKCENVLITANHNVKVCDFGFSRYVIDDNNESILSETYCGSLSYAAPEILKGVRYLPMAGDMWSFGVLIFTMLNKATPFNDTHVPVLYRTQMDKKWKFRRIIVDKLSTDVKLLVTNLLEPDVGKRYTVQSVLTCSWFEKGNQNQMRSVSATGSLNQKHVEVNESENSEPGPSMRKTSKHEHLAKNSAE